MHTENFDDLELLFHMLLNCVDENEKDFLTVLYTCLSLMAIEDGHPLFKWS